MLHSLVDSAPLPNPPPWGGNLELWGNVFKRIFVALWDCVWPDVVC